VNFFVVGVDADELAIWLLFSIKKDDSDCVVMRD
jgi:hypothetical protein